MNDQQKFTVDELGEHWGRLLSQAFAQIITLEKQVAQLEAINKILRDQVGKAELAIPVREKEAGVSHQHNS